MIAPVILDDPPQRVLDKKFWLVSSLYTASVLLDLESTHYCFAHVRGCREGNGLLPGNSLGQHMILLPIAAWSWHSAYKWKKDGTAGWWLSQAIQTGAHTFAGVHNARLISTH